MATNTRYPRYEQWKKVAHYDAHAYQGMAPADIERSIISDEISHLWNGREMDKNSVDQMVKSGRYPAAVIESGRKDMADKMAEIERLKVERERVS